MVAEFEIDIDVSGLNLLVQNQFPEVIDRAVELTALSVWGDIGREAPVRHGLLAGSYTLEKTGFAEYGIWSDVEYRWWVHEGTGIYGPHGSPVVPVKAKSLRFEIDGQVIFARSVSGQEPNRFIDRAIETNDPRTQDFINKAIQEVVS